MLLWISLVLCGLVVALTVTSVRRDARWLGNAYLIGLSLLLLIATAVLAVPGLGLVLMLTGVLAVVMAPLSVMLLVVFLLVNGAMMVRRERRTLANLLSLIAGLGIAAVLIASLIVLANPNTPLTPIALAAVLALAYIGFEFTCFVGYAWAYSRIARRVKANHVIVLGAGLKDGRTVGPLLAGRVDTGIAHYREQRQAGRPTMLVMSGGQGPDEHISEARAMADYAISRGVPESDLILEDRSTTTLENLRFTKELIGQRALGQRGFDQPSPESPGEETSMLVVTSDYHALRAAGHARRLGLPAHAVGARTASYFWPSAILREFVAVLNAQRVRHVILLALIALPLPLLLALIGWG